MVKIASMAARDGSGAICEDSENADKGENDRDARGLRLLYHSRIAERLVQFLCCIGECGQAPSSLPRGLSWRSGFLHASVSESFLDIKKIQIGIE